ncbi:MAG: hypothetical protein ACLQFI_19435 [Methylocella sp.]
MIKILLAVATTAAFSNPAEARTYMIYGPGAKSCGAMLAALNTYGESDRHTYIVWVQGYLTASGSLGEANEGFDADAIFAWMVNYCQSHPLDQVEVAAEKLLHAK